MNTEIWVKGEICEGFFFGIKREIETLLLRGEKKIIINIESNGGIVTEGMNLYHYLCSLKNKGIEINTIGWGMVASIAVAVFLAGTKRVLHQHTKFLIHLPYGGVEGTASQIRSYSDKLKSIENNILDLYCAVIPKSDKNFLYKEMAKDEFWTANKAKIYGFCTELITANNIRNAYNEKPIAIFDIENLNENLMNKNYKTLKELNLMAKINVILGANKAEVIAKNAFAKKTEFELNMLAQAGDQKLYIYTEDMNLLEKAIVLANPDGSPTETPAPDGMHDIVLEGMPYKIEVKDSVIVAFSEGASDKAQEAPQAAENMDEIKNAICELTKNIKELHDKFTIAEKAIEKVAEFSNKLKTAESNSASNAGKNEPNNKIKTFN
jgi:ATP-dependent Clp endopeptidase proteolytic subunit ClpP